MSKLLNKGYGLLPNEILYNEELSSSAKLFFVCVSSHMAEKGYCFASNSYLAEKMGMKTRQIQNLLKELKSYLYVYEEKSQRRISFYSGDAEYWGVQKIARGGAKNYTHNNTITISNHNTGAKAPDAPKEKSKANEEVNRLFWLVVKQYGLPVTNANNVRKWAKDIGSMEDGESYLQLLVDKDLRTADGEFRPTLNSAFDIINKKIKIQRFYNGGEEKKSYDPRVFE